VSSQFLPTYAASRPTIEAMKLFRPIIALICIVASFIAHAEEQRPADAKCAALPLLQGAWEGVLVGDKLQKKVTVTIAGNSLHFHRDRNFWFETTVTLPAGKDPRQLHATIKERSPSQPVSLGRVVRALFKIENEALILATIGDEPAEAPKSFEALANRYELRKVQPQTKYSQPPKPETNGFRFEARPEQAGKSEK
jgi:hypothetical protein